MTAPQHQPTDDELTAALRALRAEHPDAGIAKLHAQLPGGWLVSLKRARKVLQQENLVLKNNSNDNNDESAPRYRINDLLDVGKWSGKIQVRDFGRKRGKGLVLTDNAWAGEVLWKEDPFVVAPEPDVQDEVSKGNLCAHCLTHLKSQSNLVIACPKSCRARFCNRLCLSRATTHPFVCPSQNPASAPLLALARAKRWQAAYALLLCAARIMLAADAADQRAAFGIYESLAFVEPSAELWRKIIRPSEADIVEAYKLYTQALTQHPPKLLKNAPPLPPAMSAELLSEEGFRRGLARINLNLEVNGGLYTLHSHLNHSCAPTVAARHMDPRTALARLAVVPLWPLEPGQELTITYVDPKMGLAARRAELQAWGIARCDCTRCLEEEKQPPPEISEELKTAEVPAPAAAPGLDFGNGEGKAEGALFDVGDLEKELKSHLHASSATARVTARHHSDGRDTFLFLRPPSAMASYSTVLVMSFLLGAAAFAFGMLPLTVSFSRTRLAQLSTFGVGLLLGAGLGVIIPEGIESVTPHGAEPPTHTIALSLLGGFAAMLAIEQLMPAHSHSHQPLPTHPPAERTGRQRTLSMASDNELDLDLEIELLETNTSARSAGAGGPDGRAKALPLSLGLVIHCAADGIALGASSVAGNEASALPLIVFLALAVHKAPTALALSTSLLAAGLPKPAVRKHLVVFSLASPVAAIGTFFALAFFGGTAAGIAAWTGIALLASGGSFLYVATVLQPVSSPGASEELGRLPRLALIVAGMFTPVLISSLVGHGH